MTDYDPVESPITGANAYDRLSVGRNRKPYLAVGNVIGPQYIDAADTSVDSVEVEQRTPTGVPARGIQHDHIIAAMPIAEVLVVHRWSKNAVLGKVQRTDSLQKASVRASSIASFGTHATLPLKGPFSNSTFQYGSS